MKPHIAQAIEEELAHEERPALEVKRYNNRRMHLREYYLRDGAMTVGHLALRGPIPDAGIQHIPDYDCRKGYEALAKRFPELAGAYVVIESNVTDRLRNQGHGRRLYERALLDASVLEHRALMPDLCLADDDPNGALHETSRDALRVWDSLKKEYPHEGYVVYGGSS